VSGVYDSIRQLMLPMRQIDESLPRTGTIVDLGCGQGAIASALAQVPTRHVIGMDADTSRIDLANSKKTHTNLEFKYQDLTKLELDQIDGAVISDVLHHVVPVSSHRGILQKVYDALPSGGVFVIKEVDSSEFVRTRLSMLWDKILYPKDRTFYHHYRDLVRMLEEIGFKVTMSREVRFFPGSTTLYVSRKP
jgi:2-polyprenyl-3-methyl-5-hydroxy-6-metoxy-1,4-benzoquinol methylase